MKLEGKEEGAGGGAALEAPGCGGVCRWAGVLCETRQEGALSATDLLSRVLENPGGRNAAGVIRMGFVP